MTSVDINIPNDGSYHHVELTGTSMIVYNMSGTNVYFRYGAISTSAGMILEPQQSIMTDEDIYVKVSDQPTLNNQQFTLVVSQ